MIYVAGYASKEARDAGKSPMAERIIYCQDAAASENDLPFIDEPNRAAAYSALAALPVFAGAISV